MLSRFNSIFEDGIEERREDFKTSKQREEEVNT
jgi:hypothetical protein